MNDVRYLEADSVFAQYALGTATEQQRQLRPWLNADLVVLDDLFLAKRISESASELLQTLVHQRYKLRRSIVVTSNRVVQDWAKYLGDNTMATTILDRLMHRSHLLEYRLISDQKKVYQSSPAVETNLPAVQVSSQVEMVVPAKEILAPLRVAALIDGKKCERPP